MFKSINTDLVCPPSLVSLLTALQEYGSSLVGADLRQLKGHLYVDVSSLSHLLGNHATNTSVDH